MTLSELMDFRVEFRVGGERMGGIHGTNRRLSTVCLYLSNLVTTKW